MTVLFLACQMEVSAAVKRGKLGIGVEFAVRKLRLLASQNVADQKKTAEDALQKVQAKGISLPNFVTNALKKVAAA